MRDAPAARHARRCDHERKLGGAMALGGVAVAVALHDLVGVAGLLFDVVVVAAGLMVLARGIRGANASPARRFPSLPRARLVARGVRRGLPGT